MSRARDTADQINRINSSAANATALTIDSGERFGFGASPSSSSTVKIQNANDSTQNTLDLFNDNGNRNFTFQQDTAGNAKMILQKNDGTNAVRLDANLGGILFGTDTAAANALSDYEEGTFNAVYNQGASGGTYDRQYGYYTKVGRVVHFEIDFKPQGWSTTTADVQIGGLPFTASPSAGLYGFAVINYQGQYLTTSDTGQISFHVGGNTTRMSMYYPTGDGVGGNDVSNINGRLIISGRYFTDA